MKQKVLIKKLEAGGFVFERRGSNHDIYKRGENEFETVERHKEIPERLAQAILKRRGLIPASEMICQQITASTKVEANHLANKYAREYK